MFRLVSACASIPFITTPLPDLSLCGKLPTGMRWIHGSTSSGPDGDGHRTKDLGNDGLLQETGRRCRQEGTHYVDTSSLNGARFINPSSSTVPYSSSINPARHLHRVTSKPRKSNRSLLRSRANYHRRCMHSNERRPTAC